ncbi:hypothetical protein SAMN06297387_102433 [Streptomyces zhaozhouensis]|uniref:Lipoprotein LprG n=1 Tax=Streptomyces zhaozhouensis TaxID=1300267 RepID=A0A286DQQ9_9ACTN|nr:hypothetical protein [Streptomyces zhaozhouensis]SOD61017.1 hypothetical protein SAMN06297387_102433 [Streptomyces zhaozhouensis]
MTGVTLWFGTVACGSDEPAVETNGVDELPPEEIEERARTAATEATTVRLSGTVVAEGSSFRLDMRIGPDGGVGEVSMEDTTFELLRVGDDMYMRADAAFWETEGIPEELESDPTQKLDGKYVLVSPDDPAYAELSGFTEKNALLESLLVLDGERSTGEESEVDGVQTIQLNAAEGDGGTLDVALEGTPYPLRLHRGGDAGDLRLTDWDQEFSLHPPADEEVVDYGDEVLPEDD